MAQYRTKHLQTIHGRAVKMWLGAKGRAEFKHLPFDITVDNIEQCLNLGRCPITGIEFDLKPNQTKTKCNAYSPSIDRKDPSLGYTTANVQVVVWIYNCLKSDFDAETAKVFILRTALFMSPLPNIPD